MPDRPNRQRNSAAAEVCITLVALLLAGVAVDARVETIVVHSPSLEGNLLGDSPDRRVTVYLPPGYDERPSQRYPVAYLLHGYGATDRVWTGGGYLGDFNLADLADRLVEAGTIEPLIVVMPDASNKYGGSMYSNSSVTGNWEDFIVQELAAHIDARYRTLGGEENRGIVGHSMGGYGALKLGMKHPETYSAVYGMSPCCVGLVEPEADWVWGSAAWRETLQLENANQFNGSSFATHIHIATAAAWSPNPDNPPFYADLLFELAGDEVRRVEPAWERWRAHLPLTMLDQYGSSVKRLRAFRFDVGSRDDFPSIPTDSRAFSAALDQAGIPHVFDEYDGDHGNRVIERLETEVLPFFSETLEHEGARFPGMGFDPQPFVTLLAGQTRSVDLRLDLDPPLADLGFTRMRADLSAVGGGPEVAVGGVTGRDQRIQFTVGPLANGLYRVPVQVVGDDGRAYLLFSIEVSVFPTSDLVIVDEDLGPGWHLGDARGVEEVMTAARDIVFSGQAAARIHGKKSFAGWSVAFAANQAVPTFGYAALRFAFAPGSAEVVANDRFSVGLIPARKVVGLRDYVDFTRREWQEVEIPLDAFAAGDTITAISFSGTFGGAFYVDHVRLVAVQPVAPPTAVVEAPGDGRPQDLALLQNYPNPFNSATVINYRLPETGNVELTVFDLAGQRIATLVRGARTAGAHSVRWDGRDEAGRRMASGMYMYRLTRGTEVQQRKLLLIK